MDTQLNIIVVEDHDALRDVTVAALRAKGFHVAGVDSAEALPEMRDVLRVDLMVVDLNLPGEDGISLTRRIRQSHPDIGIVMVTARSQLAEKMEGYESGADMYLTKPASVEELNAAILALSRRLKRPPQPTPALHLDLNKLTLSGGSGRVNLALHEARLLAAFVRAPEHRLENWQLIELLDKTDVVYSKASLEVQIVRLRKKLALADVSGQSIKVIRQVGYQLCVEISVT